MHRVVPYSSAKRGLRLTTSNAANELISVNGYMYVLNEEIGQGTFGVVYKGYERNSPKSTVAIKQIKNDIQETSGLAAREIGLLKHLDHPNIIKFVDMCKTSDRWQDTYYIVLKYCECDLMRVFKADIPIRALEKKLIVHEILKGLQYLHAHNIVHRDLKPENILIDGQGVLKLSDLGSARVLPFEPNDGGRSQPLTKVVVTLWYRPPELLLGDDKYGLAVDMWSVGCILGEAWKRSALLPGHNELDQLQEIMKMCGSITPLVWPDVEELKLYHATQLWQYDYPRRVTESLWKCCKSKWTLDLLEKLLALDPKGRLDVNAALRHKLFPKKWSRQDFSMLLKQVAMAQT